MNFAPSLAPFPCFLLIQKKQQQTVPSPLPPPASSLPAVWQGKRLGCPGDYLTPRAKGRAVWAGSRAPGDPSPALARPGSPQPEPPALGPCAPGSGGQSAGGRLGPATGTATPSPSLSFLLCKKGVREPALLTGLLSKPKAGSAGSTCNVYYTRTSS